MIVTIIPARGGSKGIPKKNVHPVCGKPLIAYSIEQALAAGSIDKVYVSTDDPEIAKVSKKYGASIISRPVELSGDSASSESALVHAIEQIGTEVKSSIDYVVFLQATSPIRRQGALEKAIALIKESKADSLFSASPLHTFVWRENNGNMESVTYDYKKRPRRQELAPEYLENGSIYIFKPWVLNQLNNRLGGKIIVFPMDPLDSFQIDDPEDLTVIEKIIEVTEFK